jgi:hypothetical protein
MKWLAMTRVFRMGSILRVVVPLILAVFAGGVWTGKQWQEGRQAQAELKVIEEQADARDQVIDLQQAESAGYEQRRAVRDGSRRISDAELRAFIADRPELWVCDIGDDGLRLIESWSAPRAGRAGEPDRALPAAAAAGQRPGAGSAEQPEGPD